MLIILVLLLCAAHAQIVVPYHVIERLKGEIRTNRSRSVRHKKCEVRNVSCAVDSGTAVVAESGCTAIDSIFMLSVLR